MCRPTPALISSVEKGCGKYYLLKCSFNFLAKFFSFSYLASASSFCLGQFLPSLQGVPFGRLQVVWQLFVIVFLHLNLLG
jgi:hypothetical protein